MKTIERYLDSLGGITTPNRATSMHRVTVDDTGTVTKDEIFTSRPLAVEALSDAREMLSDPVLLHAYNKHHDEQGKFTFSTGSGSAAKSAPSDAENVRVQIGAKESLIRNLPYEAGFAVGKDGTVIVDKDGSRDTIAISNSERDAMRKDGNVVFTHNHPQGYSFSMDDIHVAASVNLAEIRAVTKYGVHIATRPVEGWQPAHTVPIVFGLASHKAREVIEPMVAEGKFNDLKEASRFHQLEVVRMASQSLKFGYRYENHKRN